jgi:pantetheine-phosphate adenylyltransferase
MQNRYGRLLFRREKKLLLHAYLAFLRIGAEDSCQNLHPDLFTIRQSPQPMKKAVYGGTFDPFTNGHLDILERACRIFDHVILAVAPNAQKGPLFNTEERMDLVRQSTHHIENTSVCTFEGLIVDFARSQGAFALIRGLRAVSDFEFEFQMTHMNRELDENMETIFFMPNHEYFFTSSSIVKQVSRFDPERIERLVPLPVAAALKKRFGHR